MAVDDVQAEQEGNAKAGFFHREALDGMRLIRAPVIEQASNPPGSNPFVNVAELAWAGHRQSGGDHVQLPDLFLDRHHREQRIDASHTLALSCAAGGWSRPTILDQKWAWRAAAADAERPARRLGRIMRK